MNSSVRVEISKGPGSWRKEHGGHAVLSFPSARTEEGVGQRTPDAGACRFLLLHAGTCICFTTVQYHSVNIMLPVSGLG